MQATEDFRQAQKLALERRRLLDGMRGRHQGAGNQKDHEATQHGEEIRPGRSEGKARSVIAWA